MEIVQRTVNIAHLMKETADVLHSARKKTYKPNVLKLNILCRECRDECPQNPKAWDIVKKVRGLK